MPDAEPSFTINEFCRLERICRATYYNLRRAGVGPDEILVGTHRRITAESRLRWHQERERAAMQRQKASEAAR